MTEQHETGGIATKTETPLGGDVRTPDIANPVANQTPPEVVSYSQQQLQDALNAQAGRHGSEIESLKRQLDLGALSGIFYEAKLEELNKQEEKLDELLASTGKEGADLAKLRTEVREKDRAVRTKEKEANIRLLQNDAALKDADNLKLLMTFTNVAKSENIDLDALMRLQPRDEEDAVRIAKGLVSVLPPRTNMHSDINVGAPANTKVDMSKLSTDEKIRMGHEKLKAETEAAKKNLS